MRVRMLTSRVSAQGVQRKGREYDFPNDEAKRMIAARQAIAVGESERERVPETASVSRATETGTRKRGQPRKIGENDHA